MVASKLQAEQLNDNTCIDIRADRNRRTSVNRTTKLVKDRRQYTLELEFQATAWNTYIVIG